ncbi:MAG: hypothetical protein IPQ04_07805 [Saprospiraceae bacterium]|nr:hypothetical protein [Saprospiraceae bacterium]
MMIRQILKNTVLKTFAFVFFMSAIISCNSNDKKETKASSTATAEKEFIPDTVVQFLITSASNDFRNHHPPTPTDFRNVRIGYITSQNNENIFVLCGELLSQENKEWVEFTTIKTSGYEQYIGKSQYCQDATIVLTDEKLTVELRNKLTERK